MGMHLLEHLSIVIIDA